jgi:hypothetical protein
MQPVDFAVWAILAIFTFFFLLNWVLKQRRYGRAILFEKRERIALQAAPWVIIGWATALLLFLFVDISELYLLLIFPLVYIVVMYQVASNITKKD